MSNILTSTEGNLTFTQYAVSDFWTGSVDADGYPVLSATVDTLDDVPYELEFSLAANLSAGAVDVAVEVWFDGARIATFEHSGAVFETQTITFDGIGGPALLEFRVMDTTGGAGEHTIDTSGVIPSYEKTVTFLGESFTVDAFMPGQNLIYQVLGGQLVKFDLTTNTYTDAEYQNPFRINAMGYSTTHDLLFGLARQTGMDSRGTAVANGDIVAFDARGATYKIASTSYSHYIGDMDENGSLWTFPGGLGQAMRYDLDTLDADGNPQITVYDLPATVRPTSGLADLAYDPGTQTFSGVAHGGSDGAEGTLFEVDISGLLLGGEAVITETAIVGTVVDGVEKAGVPSSAYGATMVDAEGTVYAGANNADHDLDSSTAKSGGFYRLVTGTDGLLRMELLADAPQVSSNDGAMDTRAVDPFLGIDTSSTVLLKEPVLSIAIAEDDMVTLAAKGVAQTVDLLSNDSVSDGESLQIISLSGRAALPGTTLDLPGGTRVELHPDGTVTVTPGWMTSSRTDSFSYTIVNDRGITDTANVTIAVSPVEGGAGNDQMVFVYRDSDGTEIDGADGLHDVILGHGGNDKIFSGGGDDDIFGGADHDFIRGGTGTDVVEGGSGNDVVDGGTGADVMRGGDGDDIYYIDHSGDVIEGETSGHDRVTSMLDWVLADPFEDLWLIEGSAALTGTGNAKANDIKGNSAANTLTGLEGDDKLEGYAGDDSLFGGAGDDHLYGAAGRDALDGGTGHDKLFGGDDDDTLTAGAGDDVLDGGAGDDVLDGGTGHDLLSGGLGADTLRGGAGDDRYIVDGLGDTVLELADAGLDTVRATISYTLGDHLERLYLDGAALVGTGNALDNAIFGNAGDNVLTGLAGDDRLDGGAGADALSGGAGRDTLSGGGGADTLLGGEDDDKLTGGDGADSLTGGAGDDRMTGGLGADSFVFALGDGTDTVHDFDTAEDILMLQGIEAAALSFTETDRGVWLAYSATDSVYLVGLETADDVILQFL